MRLRPRAVVGQRAFAIRRGAAAIQMRRLSDTASAAPRVPDAGRCLDCCHVPARVRATFTGNAPPEDWEAAGRREPLLYQLKRDGYRAVAFSTGGQLPPPVPQTPTPFAR
jgi:hypothetical protein